jgi:hypothetical protein
MTQKEVLELVEELGALRNALAERGGCTTSQGVESEVEWRSEKLCLCLLAVGKGIEKAIVELTQVVRGMKDEGGAQVPNVNGAAPYKGALTDIASCAHTVGRLMVCVPMREARNDAHVHLYHCLTCDEQFCVTQDRVLCSGAGMLWDKAKHAEVGQ